MVFLNKDYFPTNYSILINTNFDDFSFNGQVTISMQATKAIKSITLNTVDIQVESCTLTAGNKSFNPVLNENLDEEELKLDFPDEITGVFKVNFIYLGQIKSNLKGLYRTNYKIGDKVHSGAVTQFETEDARRMLPCFDEPGLKATFDLTVITDDKFTVISNTPIKSQTNNSGRKTVVFGTTPKMSTYLLFLGIADFEMIEGKLRDIQVRVLTHPGLIQYGDLALDYGKKSLDYCQNYFAIDYPLPKLDLISTPDFAAGAMENWGAILFRENALLKFPDTTKMGEGRIKSVIAHEITHQWFGNLVSPSIWKYIWLNESFATFFGFKIVDNYDPEFGIFDSPNARAFMSLNADAYHETVPIEIKDQKKTSYNVKSVPIIYGKGSAILRMIEDFLTPDLFQKGLQLFLKKHEYDVAESDDLWEALEEASKKPVINIMKSWILQPGFPLVSVTKDGSKLKFSQKRFTFLENNYSTVWQVPITLTVFKNNNEPVKLSFLLGKEEAIFDVGFEFSTFKLNNNRTGFYRVLYESQNLEKLGELIRKENLSSLDCRNIISDNIALFKAGIVPLDELLAFISNFSKNLYHTSIDLISDFFVDSYYLAKDKSKDIIREKGINFHESIFDKIGYSYSEKEHFRNSILRDTLLKNASILGSTKSIDFCLQQFKKIEEGKPIQADIKNAVLSVTASQLNNLSWFEDSYSNAKNESDLIDFGNALGDFSDEGVIDKVLETIVFDKIPLRNQANIIDHLCNNPNAIGKMWKFYIANLDNFGKMPPGIQGRAISSIISNSVDEETKKDMEKFFEEYGKNNMFAKLTSEKALETLQINLNIKKYINN